MNVEALAPEELKSIYIRNLQELDNLKQKKLQGKGLKEMDVSRYEFLIEEILLPIEAHFRKLGENEFLELHSFAA